MLSLALNSDERSISNSRSINQLAHKNSINGKYSEEGKSIMLLVSSIQIHPNNFQISELNMQNSFKFTKIRQNEKNEWKRQQCEKDCSRRACVEGKFQNLISVAGWLHFASYSDELWSVSDRTVRNFFAFAVATHFPAACTTCCHPSRPSLHIFFHIWSHFFKNCFDFIF